MAEHVVKRTAELDASDVVVVPSLMLAQYCFDARLKPGPMLAMSWYVGNSLVMPTLGQAWAVRQK